MINDATGSRQDDSDPERSATVGPSKPRLLKILGPGLITGASDDDPSGIATYSQAGAIFGFTQNVRVRRERAACDEAAAEHGRRPCFLHHVNPPYQA